MIAVYNTSGDTMKSWDTMTGWFINERTGKIEERPLHDLSLITKRGLDKKEQVNVRTSDDMVVWYFQDRTEIKGYEDLEFIEFTINGGKSS